VTLGSLGGDLPFELRQSSIAGRGAFATRPIKKGTRIIEYTGERISNAEADRRYDEDKMSSHHTFLFTLNRRTVVDAGVGGNEARFINHSCSPNCEAVIEDGKRIYIEALRDIQVGEELAYDYQYERTDDHTEADERFYACRCGAPGCRGTILAPKKPKKNRGPRSRGRRVKQRR
jgi:SET domain-containing protein